MFQPRHRPLQVEFIWDIIEYNRVQSYGDETIHIGLIYQFFIKIEDSRLLIQKKLIWTGVGPA